MRIAAIACNAVLFALTGVDVLTEGVPRDTYDLILTLLVLLVPLFSAVVLLRERMPAHGPSARDERSSKSALTHRAAVLCNLVLFGASCWATVARYPYPEGRGVIPFAILAVIAPILSLLALFDVGGRAMRLKAGVGSPRGRAASPDAR